MNDLSPLVERVRTTVDWTVDTDEMAALLESSGVNDRVASREYGYPTVFTLASEVRRAAPAVPFGPAAARVRSWWPTVRDTLVRAALYLTPTVVAVGFAPRLGQLPWYATVALLVAGWGCAPAFAWLGYSVAGESGPAAAARPLGIGFLVFAASWTALLVRLGAGPREYAVCAAQLAMFAANTAALVTGAERRTMCAASGCWLAVGTLLAGAPGPALVLLAGSLCAMVVLAYLPAFRRGNRWHWPGPGRYPTALRHGLVGAGQGVLFVLLVLHRISTVSTPLSVLPLLAGVPLAELTLVWHQHRVAEGRRLLAHRAGFQRHLRRTAARTTLCVALPLVLAAWPATHVLLGHAPGWAQLTQTVLLAGINALCLVFVAHRRPLTAALLVWWPAALVAAVWWAPAWLLPTTPAVVDRVATATLLCAYPPALTLAAMALRDPWSYR